jgi:hypothetical protein
MLRIPAAAHGVNELVKRSASGNGSRANLGTQPAAEVRQHPSRRVTHRYLLPAGTAGSPGVSDAPVGFLHLQVDGHGHGVRCPSPCVMYPLPPQSVQQPGLGSGFGSGALSGAVAA